MRVEVGNIFGMDGYNSVLREKKSGIYEMVRSFNERDYVQEYGQRLIIAGITHFFFNGET